MPYVMVVGSKRGRGGILFVKKENPGVKQSESFQQPQCAGVKNTMYD